MKPSDFENQLRALRPSAPRAGLEDAIAAELARPRAHASGFLGRSSESRFARLFGGLCWATGGAAVAIILSMWLDRPGVAPDSPTARNSVPRESTAESYFEPTESDRELLWAEAGDLVYDEDQQLAQVLNYAAIERYVWANPATGARLEVEVPHEERVLVPVSFQ